MIDLLRRNVPASSSGMKGPEKPVYQHMSHGPILPMERPTFVERLFRWR